MFTLKDIQKILANKTLLISSITLLIVLIVYLVANTIIYNITPIQVESTTLIEGQDLNIVSGNLLSITFTKSISDSDKSDLVINIDPQTDLKQIWNPSNKTVTLSNTYPLPSLKTNQIYKIAVNYKNQLLKEVSFRTISYYSLDQQQQFVQFKEGQDALHQDAQRIITARPWTKDLPIIKNNYLIFWEDSTETIQVQIYAKKAKIDNEQKLNQLKQEIILELGQKQIDTNNQKINYTLLDL